MNSRMSAFHNNEVHLICVHVSLAFDHIILNQIDKMTTSANFLYQSAQKKTPTSSNLYVFPRILSEKVTCRKGLMKIVN